MLSNINISGEVFCEHAYLSYDMCFNNTQNGDVVAEYIFSLPMGAVISDLKIILADKKVIKPTVISATHAARMWEASASGFCMNQIDDVTYVLRIGAIGRGESHIRLRAYVYMPRLANESVLTIPLTRGVGDSGDISCDAEISLILHNRNGDAKYFSPTHTLIEEKSGSGTMVSTGNIAADRDFSVRVLGDRINSAIAAQGALCSSMLCRLYPDKSFFAAAQKRCEKLLIIYDATGSLTGGASRVGRTLLLEMAKGFKGDFAAVMTGDKPILLTDGFCKCNDENISELAKGLSYAATGGSLSEALGMASEMMEDDVLPVLVSGTEVFEEIYIDKLNHSGICSVTLGAVAAASNIDNFVKRCGGLRAHIFGNDNISDRACEILEEFKSLRCKKIEVTSSVGLATVISDTSNCDEGITVFVQYRGDVVPREFILRGEIEQRIVLDDVSIYHSFAPIQLVWAEYLSAKLKKKIEVCPISELQGLREQLEEVGIKYSIINSETAMAAVFDGTKTEAIRTVIKTRAQRPCDVFENKASAFNEVDEARLTNKQGAELIDACMDIIIRSVRADGAICTDGEIDMQLRKGQTLVCILALVCAGCAEKYSSIIEAARDYIDRYHTDKIYYTEDAIVAKEMLENFFGKERGLPAGFVPDLLTAARMIAQN